MTEEEAKTKWCPFALYVRAHSLPPAPVALVAANRGHYGEAETFTSCIASACMAWRWNDNGSQTAKAQRLTSKGDGYCGLAGRPE